MKTTKIVSMTFALFFLAIGAVLLINPNRSSKNDLVNENLKAMACDCEICASCPCVCDGGGGSGPGCSGDFDSDGLTGTCPPDSKQPVCTAVCPGVIVENGKIEDCNQTFYIPKDPERKGKSTITKGTCPKCGHVFG